MGRPMCRRRSPLNEWITNLVRSTFAVDAGCTFALGRLDGRSDGKLDGTVFAIAVDKNAPFSLTYLANTARHAVVGQAKNRSPVHHLPAFERAPMTWRWAKQVAYHLNSPSARHLPRALS